MDNIIRWLLALYPVAKLLSLLGLGPPPVQYQDIDEENAPRVNPNPSWKVTHKERVSACNNRPGLKKIYLRVVDAEGVGLSGIKVRFASEHGRGMAFDHPNIWGVTGEQGFIEWDHYGFPTRYMLWMEGDETPLIENISTILGYEYCRNWKGYPGGWIPVNKPGIYSFRFEVQRKVA